MWSIVHGLIFLFPSALSHEEDRMFYADGRRFFNDGNDYQNSPAPVEEPMDCGADKASIPVVLKTLVECSEEPLASKSCGRLYLWYNGTRDDGNTSTPLTDQQKSAMGIYQYIGETTYADGNKHPVYLLQKDDGTNGDRTGVLRNEANGWVASNAPISPGQSWVDITDNGKWMKSENQCNDKEIMTCNTKWQIRNAAAASVFETDEGLIAVCEVKKDTTAPWEDDGVCMGVGADKSCGKGKQMQTRICKDGNMEKCTDADTMQSIECNLGKCPDATTIKPPMQSTEMKDGESAAPAPEGETTTKKKGEPKIPIATENPVPTVTNSSATNEHQMVYMMGLVVLININF